MSDHLISIFDEPMSCLECGWVGTVRNCEPDVDGEGSLGCPKCGAVAKDEIDREIDAMSKEEIVAAFIGSAGSMSAMNSKWYFEFWAHPWSWSLPVSFVIRPGDIYGFTILCWSWQWMSEE